MNPHFIFNCLNSIQSFIMQNNKQDAMDYLSSFAQLIRLNLNASVEQEISLYNEIQILENYITLERLRFQNSFEYTITVDSALDQMDTEIPPMLIQPIVENAIVHGMSSLNEGGIIDIRFDKHENGLAITVGDNGTNTRKSQSLHKSLGMDITQRRLSHTNRPLSRPIQTKRVDGWTVVSMVVKV